MSRSLAILLCLLPAPSVYAGGEVGDNQRISSEVLGYDLQYRVFVPDGHDDLENLPTLYVTDGQWYLVQGYLGRVMERMVGAGEIEPVIGVFVDSADPDRPRHNRRNQQFGCNQDYVDFYEDELLPRIESDYNVSTDRERRVILGVSFGGLNSACFGLMAFPSFGGIAMHSPALHPVPEIVQAYAERPRLPLKIFLSVGHQYDNVQENRSFARVLGEKGYDLRFMQVRGQHNWDNWRPLMDDVLEFYFAPDSE